MSTISKLDYFAAKAMQAMITKSDLSSEHHSLKEIADNVAETAYVFATAMMETSFEDAEPLATTVTTGKGHNVEVYGSVEVSGAVGSSGNY